MAKERCFDVLKDIKNMSSNLRFSEDNPFQDLLAMTTAEDSKRLENANKQLLDATNKYQSLLSKEKAANDYYMSLQNKLKELETRYEKLVSGEFVHSSNMESVEKLKEEIANNKNILSFYRQATGVRLSFNAPADIVAGYVAVKNDDPSQCALEPFTIKKSEKNISNEIWKKISDVSETEKNTEINISTLNEQN